MDRNRAVCLIGMPGAGKSTVGVLLAKRLARPFVDTDVLIQAGTGRTLQQIIDDEGVTAFRRLEERFVCAMEVTDQVIATGGSVVYSDTAMRRLAGRSVVVYLAVSQAVLHQRLGDVATRGLVIEPGMTLDDLYAERRDLYARWADVTIPCDGLNHYAVIERVAEATT